MLLRGGGHHGRAALVQRARRSLAGARVPEDRGGRAARPAASARSAAQSTAARCASDDWSGNLHPFAKAPAYTWNTHAPRAGLYTWFGRRDIGPYATGISPPDLTDLFTRPDLQVSSTKVGAVREWFAHRWFQYQALPPDKTPNGCGPQILAPR
jgi:hypothetical protein